MLGDGILSIFHHIGGSWAAPDPRRRSSFRVSSVAPPRVLGAPVAVKIGQLSRLRPSRSRYLLADYYKLVSRLYLFSYVTQLFSYDKHISNAGSDIHYTQGEIY